MTNLFNERPTWTELWIKRVKDQNIKKLGEFNFKILHKILPNQENLFKWKLSNSKTCRFGCNLTENYHHMFLQCPYLKPLHNKIENILSKVGYNIKMTYKLLIMGYKCMYNAYDDINTLLSIIFYSICKFWIRNDKSICINSWIKAELTRWKCILDETSWNCNRHFAILVIKSLKLS